MGTIDSTTYELRCPKCGAFETQVVRERGSSYGSSWGELAPFERFATTESKHPWGEPKVETATCKGCGIAAIIK